MPRCEMCGEWPDCPWKTDPEILCGEFHPKPMTNAMKIRSMTDEELAELWWERMDCGECPAHRDCKMTGQECKKLALDWLKQEAASDG